MKIYNYDPTSGAFTGEAVADADPMNVGAFLIPAFATTLVPPPEHAGTTRAFANGGWGYTRTADPTTVTDEPPGATEAEYVDAIQAQIDATATSKQFRDATTLASYAVSTNETWKAEALAFIAWRDAVWAYVYGELTMFQNGQRTQPTVGGLLAELPTIQWPSV